MVHSLHSDFEIRGAPLDVAFLVGLRKKIRQRLILFVKIWVDLYKFSKRLFMNIFQPKIGVLNDVSPADFSLAVGPHNDNIYIQTDIYLPLYGFRRPH